MPLQCERDTKNSLRFFLTLAEDELPSVSVPALSLTIAKAEKLLLEIKNAMMKSAASTIVSSRLKDMLPSGSLGDTKLYHVKRPKAGTIPAHHRVGIQVTFNDPAHAQKFAAVLKIP